MAMNLAEKLLASHLLAGDARPGDEVALRVDQTLMPDSGGPAVCAALEAMGIEHSFVANMEHDDAAEDQTETTEPDFVGEFAFEGGRTLGDARRSHALTWRCRKAHGRHLAHMRWKRHRTRSHLFHLVCD